MSRNSKTVYKKRAFLNDDKSMSGFIVAYLDKFSYDFKETRDIVSSYPTLDIGDCSNKVCLDFSFYSPADLKRALKKLRLFTSTIVGFTEAFEKEVERFNEAAAKNTVVPKKKRARRVTQVEIIND